MWTYVIQAVGAAVVLIVGFRIVREEWQGRGVFRWHGDDTE